MMFRSLQTRFVIAGCLLVLTTVAGGVWSVVVLGRLSTEVGRTLRKSQETIDLTTELANTLEREDDALLLALSGKVRNARSEVAQQRKDFDEAYGRLGPLLTEADERSAGQALGQRVDEYRTAGDALLANAEKPDARDLYHQRVNPLLRLAGEDCAKIRELNFRSMQKVGLDAHNETRRSMAIVGGVALVALGLTTLLMVRLAQGILRPVQELTRSIEAIRRNDFNCRVSVSSQDELGQLAQGFNQMSERLGDYRQSSLGELLLAKSTLDATVAALPDAVIVIDPDRQIVMKNPLAAQILEAIGGKNATHVDGLPLPTTVLSHVDETLRDGHSGVDKPDLGQTLSVPLGGSHHKMLVTVVPIAQYLPHRAGAAIVLADVTEFARLDELRGEVVAVASHELKTPLTSVQMNLLMLQEQSSGLTARQQEILGAAVAGGEELAATIDELLDLTRIEAGELQLAKERVDLYALVDRVSRTLRPRYQDSEVSLRIIRDAPAAFVEGDPARLKIVLVNLLTNALKYTPRGGEVTVRLASWQNAEGGNKPRLQITVTDSGPGIPPELRQQVFEKFYRVEDHRPDGPKGVRGTGIGLYLCREIMQAHGGTITCENGEGGRGTRIALTLNLKEV